MSVKKLTAFQLSSIQAIEKINKEGFNFDFNQRNHTTYVYNEKVNIGPLESIDYQLICCNSSWRVQMKANYNLNGDISLVNNDKAVYNNEKKWEFVCMFTI